MTSVPVRRPAPGGTRPVVELAEHAQAARAGRRSRRRRRVGTGLLLLVPLAGLAWVLLVSSWLAVDRLQVVGESRLSAAEVEQAAGVLDGTPLARVDTGAVERRVGALAPVARVAASRSWPGTLRVTVTERTAVAGVVAPTGFTLVDASGTLFGTERALPPGVVRLEVGSPGPDDPTTRAALAVQAALPAALRDQVRVVRAASPSSVVLLTADGTQVVWGGPGDTPTKAAAALVLLRTESTVVDVSTPGVVVRRGGPSAEPSPQG